MVRMREAAKRNTGAWGDTLRAIEYKTGKTVWRHRYPLWHAGLGANVSNGPESYMLDGQQYLVVGAGDSLFEFTVAQ
jgi:hypothetical protein